MHYMKPSPFAMCSISFSINCNLPSVLDAPSTGGGKKKEGHGFKICRDNNSEIRDCHLNTLQ